MSTGKPQPWLLTRSRLADRWRITPWAVDAAPAREIALALRLSGIEREVGEWKPR